MAERKQGTLDRRAVTAALLKARKDALIVTGLGSSCYDVGTEDHPNTFYLWGGMGAAAMMGLGLALAQPMRRVVVITGDGEMLMGMGALATIGIQQPQNLAVIVFDNGMYGETGGQPSHTAGGGIDMVSVARSCRFPTCLEVSDEAGLDDLAARLKKLDGLLFARVTIRPDEPPRVLPEKDGTVLKRRFRTALGLTP